MTQHSKQRTVQFPKGNDSEEWRRECEARYWLVKTGGEKRKVDALMERIVAKRGKAGSNLLMADMRIASKKVTLKKEAP